MPNTLDLIMLVIFFPHVSLAIDISIFRTYCLFSESLIWKKRKLKLIIVKESKAFFFKFSSFLTSITLDVQSVLIILRPMG